MFENKKFKEGVKTVFRQAKENLVKDGLLGKVLFVFTPKGIKTIPCLWKNDSGKQKFVEKILKKMQREKCYAYIYVLRAIFSTSKKTGEQEAVLVVGKMNTGYSVTCKAEFSRKRGKIVFDLKNETCGEIIDENIFKKGSERLYWDRILVKPKWN